MSAANLPANFFDSEAPSASSASLSGRQHLIEGFFDAPQGRDPHVGEKRGREDDEDDEPEMDEMEEGDDDQGEEQPGRDIDQLLEEAEPVEVMDLQQLKRNLATLEKKISKNQELRIKHADDPQKFMESEVELFEELQRMRALATAPELYEEFVKMHGAQRVCQLLDHENADIAMAAVDLIMDLTDPEVLVDVESDSGLQSLLTALVDNAFPEMLVSNLDRLDESEEDAKQGVNNTLQIIENLSEVMPAMLETICEKTGIIEWLFNRLSVKAFEANKVYSSEVLSILCQNSEVNQRKVGAGEGMDRLLQLVAGWKKKDPKDEHEAELIQNLFNVICSALMVPDNQNSFQEGEGVELMVIMLQARKFAAKCALKVLDYAMLKNTSACERFVNAMGLKTLFPAFLKPSSIFQSKLKELKGATKEDEEHIVSIISSLLLRLSGDQHSRVVGKFIENNFEKLDRLIELHEKYFSRVQNVEVDDDEEEDEEGGLTPAERYYLARLDKGLFTLQQVDTTVAFLLSEGVPGIQKRVEMLLHQSGASLEQVVSILTEYHENMGEEKGAGEDLNMKEVSGDLADFMKDYVKSPNGA